MRTEKFSSFVVEIPRIDYLSMTSFEPTSWQFWKDQLRSTGELIQDDKPTHLQQYSGYYWRNGNGNAYLGSGMQKRGEHIWLRVSGDMAQENFYRLAKNPVKEMWGKVTRLDLQITVPMPETWSQKRYLYRLMKAGKNPDTRSSESGLNRRVLRTVYLGSRYSNRYHRTYEKQIDNGDMYLRYECEFHDNLAHKMARELIINDTRISGYLLAELQAIGDEKHEALFAKHLTGEPTRETVRRVQEQDRTRRWLLERVLPAFQRHINGHDSDGIVAISFGRAIGNALGKVRPEQWD